MKKTTSEEKEFLQQYDSSMFEKPSVAVDVLIFTIEDDTLKVVMVERSEFPYKGCLALPGVFVGIDESLEDAVKRGVKVETGLTDMYFEQLYTWGDVKRDPRMRIISVSYMALVSIDQLCAKSANGNIRDYLYPVEEVLTPDKELAFDHKEIIAYARTRIKNKAAAYSDIAFNFMSEKFTLPKLQKVYEILMDKPLYKANFRKKVSPMVLETEESTSGEAHRPSKLYVKNADYNALEE
ncbi:MAG: NUDIX hydrolase [Lachnospiraceae bacterium]|nr:NUDIX hydrolase [Lachnospiraceae bacterium]MBO5325974.1 NUDIX hydrolase [Lachnospiraceae bacterium]